ncbi:MFS transporter [Thauera sinica]|uniref:MFS transporter n=1 Tax=Thauera sinica TaxID=2665146 RepID=A0ABW1ATS9_9RHOO|nr:aromatic acid/H+ symport family MFS transporter [Thauera sp. K11]ATE61287.1 aromatic acid/H+ symport family MFS transporter [Thauera sp. K11]
MATVDVHKIIDEAKFNRFHLNVLFWCALVIIFDGYDLVIYGVVLPKLMEQWALSPIEAGALGSYALFGMMFGALIFGPLSDKIGRKKVIMITVLIFSGMTFLNGFATTPTQFGICRFIAGLGIGGVMPNVVALMTEYMPKKIRSTMVAVMFSGYSVGGMTSAFLGMYLMPNYGWQAVFFVAGVPLLLLPLIWFFLPDAVGFLIQARRETEAGGLLSRVEPSFRMRAGDTLHYPTGKGKGAALGALFQNGRLLSTLMYWVAFFGCLLMVYALGSWLPKLMVKAGYDLKNSLAFLLVLNFGAIFGAIGGGWLADRFHLRRVLTIMFVIAALSIGGLGFLPKEDQGLLYLFIAVAGACTIGAQILLYAYVAQYYPLAIRSTGIGWASGVGRLGAISGPMLGGFLVSAELAFQFNFLAFAVPGAIAGLAISMVGRSAVHAPEEEKNLAFAAETGMMEVD